MVRESDQGPTMRQAEVLTTKLRHTTQSLATLIFGEWGEKQPNYLCRKFLTAAG